MIPAKGLSTKLLRQVIVRCQAWIVRVIGTVMGKLSIPGPRWLSWLKPLKGRWVPFFPMYSALTTILLGSWRSNPKLQLCSLGVRFARGGAQRTIGVEAHVVQQAERISRGLNQSVGEGIVQVQVRSGAIVVKGGDHVGGLVETLAAVGDDAGDARARLSVVNSVTAAHYRLRSKLVGKADARLNVAPVGHVVCALAWSWQKLRRHSMEQLTGWPVTGSV